MNCELIIDEQLADILRTAAELHSKIDKCIGAKKYAYDEYPGNVLDKMEDDIGRMMCNLGDVIGHEIASQAFDACLNN